MYAIRRHKAAINAWCWRVNFKRRGKSYSKSFYDITCGGSRKAKMNAIAWRNEKLKEIEALSLREFYQQKRSNNVSGVAGVHFHKTSTQPLGFWQAAIRLRDGKRLSKSFSVLMYGNMEAFDLAVAARAEMLAKVDDRKYLYDPLARKLSAK
jgi:hypothetical protein